MQDYHKLLVWKRAFALVTLVYRLTARFPKEEQYSLTTQLRRSAVSVVANIVEGRGKPTEKDFLKFLYISNGSLSECQCYFEIALELEFINKTQFDFVEEKRREVGYLLHKLIQSIQ